MKITRENAKSHDCELVWWVVSDMITRVELGVPDSLWNREEKRILVNRTGMVKMIVWSDEEVKMFTDFEEAADLVREIISQETAKKEKSNETDKGNGSVLSGKENGGNKNGEDKADNV